MLKIFLFCTLINLGATYAAEDAETLVRKADDHRGVKGSNSVQVKVTVYDGGEIQEQVYSVKIRDADSSLIEQISPARAKGRKLLMKGLDMWIFTPQVKKAVRISLQQKLTGDVANGDISRTRFSGDYRAKLIGQDPQLHAHILELFAIDKRATYQHIKYWVAQDTYQPVQAQFFALSGKLMKTATFSDFKAIHGIPIMTKVTIQDAVIAKNKSILSYSLHTIEKFNDSLFNKEQMDR